MYVKTECPYDCGNGRRYYIRFLWTRWTWRESGRVVWWHLYCRSFNLPNLPYRFFTVVEPRELSCVLEVSHYWLGILLGPLWVQSPNKLQGYRVPVHPCGVDLFPFTNVEREEHWFYLRTTDHSEKPKTFEVWILVLSLECHPPPPEVFGTSGNTPRVSSFSETCTSIPHSSGRRTRYTGFLTYRSLTTLSVGNPKCRLESPT